jgi:ABC-type sugar transport system permease subunit
LIVAGTFGIGMAHVLRYFNRMARASSGVPLHRGRVRERGFPKASSLPTARILPYLFLFPALTLILLWQYLPLAGGAAISVTDYQLVRASTFAGVDNFADVLFDEKFWAALAHTIYYVALIIGLGFWPPILLAILLQEVPTQSAKYFFRVVYYLPALVSGVIVMFLWHEFYDASEHGILNQLIMSVNYLGPVSATALKLLAFIVSLSLILLLLQSPSRLFRVAAVAFIGVTTWMLVTRLRPIDLVGRFQVEPLQWINSPGLAMLCVVIPIVWAASGHASILYLAALKNIPEELYEAAELDGASWSDKIFFIVLPRLKYLLVIQFIAAVIGAFKGGADYILALTGGGPNNATDVLALEIFQRTFLDLKFGLGAAMAWLLGAILVGFTAYQLKMLSRVEFRAGGG